MIIMTNKIRVNTTIVLFAYTKWRKGIFWALSAHEDNKKGRSSASSGIEFYDLQLEYTKFYYRTIDRLDTATIVYMCVCVVYGKFLIRFSYGISS